jgi:5-histidylcysteine sulfoxide synthase/putative 4-mercaptohistidine N1-methyltranferase
MERKYISSPLLKLDANRETILEYFKNTWSLTELLFSGISKEETYYRRPYHKIRHPLIFYYGHPAVLYVNKLRVAGLLETPIDPQLETLLETGVDEMRWDDMREGDENLWPSVQRVREYRSLVFQAVCRLIETHPELETKNLPITHESRMWALVMSFEHERIHLETSSVLMRELPIQFLQPPAGWPLSMTKKKQTDFPKNHFIHREAGTVSLGKPQDWPTFGWDNEYGHEERNYQSFSTSSFLISNGEFLEFVKNGGYSEEANWSQEGWQWKRFRNIKWPTFWVADGPAGLHQFKIRTIFEIIDMQWDWPVCVNFYEARAFCQWKSQQENETHSYRLLTEAEHLALRDTKSLDPVMHKRSDAYNHNLVSGSESPVDAYPANDKGIHDSLGNVWQWCEDTFHPLSGSKPHPYYDDFSSPCYDGKHQMILGGSFISTGAEASIWARFHFRPHFFQHAGFRIVKEAKKMPGNYLYEGQEMVNKYLLMHWGEESDIHQNVPHTNAPFPQVVHLPVKCAQLMEQFSLDFGRALDLGCAVGRSTIELSRSFAEVIGIDYSQPFIECANKIKQDKRITYWRKDSGESGKEVTLRLSADLHPERSHFEQGDACHLPIRLGQFDSVLLANVLCRLEHPMNCLKRMQGENGLVRPGGILVMTTPFSWLEEYTAKENWLQGIPDVKKVLTEFELIYQEELPFMIREHARKFEYIITLASVWRRKPSSIQEPN